MVKRTAGPVRILAGAMDETVNKDIVLRGVVDPGSLASLLTDDYQREAAPLTALSSLLDALQKGETLPDIELGMRGEDYSVRNGIHLLKDSVYIIDGLQRVNASLHHLQENPEAQPRIGATIHFGTSKEWERERFRILNTLRNKVSPNILLRNLREESQAVAMIHSLTTADKNFVLSGRVTWSQRAMRGELISALSFAKIIGYLHSHKVPAKRSRVDELVPALDRSVEVFGIQNLRNNSRWFYDLVDECWGIKRIQYREGASYIKTGFLTVLARVLSDHLDFWKQPDEKSLFIEAQLKRKIAQFPVHDPQVMNLAGAGAGKSRDMLYILLRDHINSGKRSRRLRSRRGDQVSMNDDDEGGEE